MLQIKLNSILLTLILLFALYEAIFIIMNNKIYNFPLKVLSIVVILGIINIGMQRNIYLPFLGPSVLPDSLLKRDFAANYAKKSYIIPIKEKNGLRVIYWASKKSNKVFENPWDAYKGFDNVGISTIRNGDILCFNNAGAYCHTMSNNYNSRYRPAEVIYINGEFKLIRKRENFQDLVRNQIDIFNQ